MNKEIYIVGSGGREHAIGWKLKNDDPEREIKFIPGNGGTLQIGESLGSIEDIGKAGLVVIGPEKPLAEGLAKRLAGEGIAVFGPTREASQLEWSKAFAQKFMEKFKIPHARGEVFSDYNAARFYINFKNSPCVVKADGLAAGKGAWVCESPNEAQKALKYMMVEKKLGKAGKTVVIQEKLEGKETSIMAFCDGKVAIPMIPSCDHKRLLAGDQGPNTGGMGAYAPAENIVNGEMLEEIRNKILQPTVDYMREIGRPFKGVLYPGLMITSDGPKVLEYNCRFGDPETQATLPLLETDLLDLFEASVSGDFGNARLFWKEKYAVCVILAQKGYPGKVEDSNKPIRGLKELEKHPYPDLYIFHSGTKLIDGEYFSSDGAGRILGITATSSTLIEAIDKAYSVIGDSIKPQNFQYRSDIGKKGLI